jgi:hypothetical protein
MVEQASAAAAAFEEEAAKVAATVNTFTTNVGPAPAARPAPSAQPRRPARPAVAIPVRKAVGASQLPLRSRPVVAGDAPDDEWKEF